MANGMITITRKKDNLRKTLDGLVPGVNGAINEANAQNAEELLAAILPRAPRKTGEYAASLRVGPIHDNAARADQAIKTTFRMRAAAGRNKGKMVTRGARAKDTLAYGLFAKFIWRHLEFGTTRTAARPHIMPTYRSLRKRFTSRTSRAVNKVIKATGR